MKFDKSIKLTINANMCDIINFYTVYEGCINVGDLSKYISVGTKSKKKVKLEEIL